MKFVVHIELTTEGEFDPEDLPEEEVTQKELDTLADDIVFALADHDLKYEFKIEKAEYA